MRKLLILFVIVISTIDIYPQGHNSKWGSYKGTPYEQQPAYWSGSGIAVNSHYIATNHHVVDGATNITVKISDDENTYKAEVVTYDSENDLAIIRVVDDNFAGFGKIRFGFKPELEDIGVEVFVLGYPLITTMGTDIKLTTGVISSKNGFQGDVSQYQISAPVQPGNSGGPLFNDKGELIGIVSAKYTEAENVGYSVKLSYLYPLVDNIHDLELTAKSQISNLSLSDKCKEVIPFSVLIEANNERPRIEYHGKGYENYPKKQPNHKVPNVVR